MQPWWAKAECRHMWLEHSMLQCGCLNITKTMLPAILQLFAQVEDEKISAAAFDDIEGFTDDADADNPGAAAECASCNCT